MKTKGYNFSISLYERKSLIVALTLLFIILDFIMIYPSMQAAETQLTKLRQISIFMQAAAVVLLLDLPTGMLGEAISKFFGKRMIRKAALAAAGILFVFLIALYGQVCMLKIESAKLSAQTTTTASRFEDTNKESSILDIAKQQDDNTEIVEQKEKIAEKTAAITNILPLTNSVFLLILSGAGAKKRKMIRLADREKKLFAQRNKLIRLADREKKLFAQRNKLTEEQEMYRGLASEEQLITSNTLAMQDMIHRTDIYVNTWKRDVLFSAAAHQENNCYTADLLRAADMDITNNNQLT